MNPKHTIVQAGEASRALIKLEAELKSKIEALEKSSLDNIVPRFAKGVVGEIINKIREANLAKKDKFSGDMLQSYKEATGGIEEITINNRKITIALVYLLPDNNVLNNKLNAVKYISSTYAAKEKAKDKQYRYVFKDLVLSNAVTNTYSQNKPCLLFYIGESDAEVFEKYLELIKNNPVSTATSSTIQLALNAMEQLTDKHIPYEQETSPRTLRTDETPEALAKMDCSEFVSRYLKTVGLFDQVPDFTTDVMKNIKSFEKKCDNKLQFLENSNKADFKDIQAGDIFVWRRTPAQHPPNGDGHTGIVKSYDPITDIVEVMEALGGGGSADNSRNVKVCDHGCTRTSKYKRDKGALYGHAGWVGYYRPVIK